MKEIPKACDSASEDITFNPLQVLREAIKAVPVMRFALGVLGLVAIVAIVSAWRIDFKVAVFGSLIILGLMVILAFFAKAMTRPSAKKNRDFLHHASLFFVCVFGLLITFAALFLLTASVFGWPREFSGLLFPGDKPTLWDEVKRKI